jgi:hypothetical protein
MQKLTSWFTTGSGLALVVTFIMAGLAAIQGQFTGNVYADIGTIVAILGLITHPTNMTAGRANSLR